MQRKTVTYTRYRPTERVLSTVLIASIRVVVVGIENRAQNDASGPGHARVPLTRYLHVLGQQNTVYTHLLPPTLWT